VTSIVDRKRASGDQHQPHQITVSLFFLFCFFSPAHVRSVARADDPTRRSARRKFHTARSRFQNPPTLLVLTNRSGLIWRMQMNPLELVKLTSLMARSRGSAAVKIGLIDGPVATGHPDLVREQLREISSDSGAACTNASSSACMHGTFVAGVLAAKRTSSAPAICPGCTLLLRPIFAERITGSEQMPGTTPEALAAAILDCINAGARVINLSLALAQPSSKGERSLEDALDAAARRSVIVVAAAGNQGMLGSSAITRHPWAIPVAACDHRGRPMNESNLGSSIGRRGLIAPGDAITSLGAEGRTVTLGGTSVAVPFVTGAIALLWSEFPAATAAQIKLAIGQASAVRRASVVPPLLNAAAAHDMLLATNARRIA
jgi:subtilisin family serine protease